MPLVNTPDGLVNFPDDMSESEIKAVLQEKFPPLEEPDVEDYARAAFQGITFGFGDEIEARYRASRSGKPYEEELENVRAEIEAFKQAAPISSVATEVAGAIPTALAGGGAIRAGLSGLGARGGIVGGAAEGAAGGGVYAAGTAEEGERLEAAKGGAALGAGLGGALGAVLPPMSPEARELVRRGVPLTAGQAMGGVPRAFERSAEALPFVGGVVSGAQRRAISQYSRIATEDAVSPILGKTKFPKNITGDKAVDRGFSIVSKEYDRVVPKLGVSKATDVDSIIESSLSRTIADSVLDEATEKTLRNDIKKIKQLLSSKSGNLSGKQIHTAIKKMGSDANKLSKFGADPMNIERGRALRSVQQSLFDFLESNNPKYAQQLRNANEAFKRMLVIERASVSAIKEGGEFAPSQQLSRLASANRRAAARGQAQGQQDVLAAREILEQGRAGIARPILEARQIMSGLGTAGLAGTAGIAPAAAGLGSVGAAYSRALSPQVRRLFSSSADIGRGAVPMYSGLLGQE